MNKKYSTINLDKYKSSIEDDLKIINQYTRKELTKEDVYIFPVILCDNEIDRDYDKISDSMLEEIVQNSVMLSGLKNHDWDCNNQTARLFKSVILENENEFNSLGEPLKSVLGYAYTLTNKVDLIKDIDAGLLSEVSIGFENGKTICSICGQEVDTDKETNELSCKHIKGKIYDDKVCYTILKDLKDLYEFSLVAVPAQRNAGIVKNKEKGEGLMKKSKFFLKRLLKSASTNEEDIEEVVKGMEDDTEVSDEDIDKLIEENVSLKATVKDLETKVKELEDGKVRDNIGNIVSKMVDDMNPLTPVVKENILKEVGLENLSLNEKGEVEGIDDIMTNIKSRYKGLLVEKEEETEPTEKGEEEDSEVKSKGFKANSINFNIGDNKVTKSATNKKQGLSFR